jgi:hypothetical protein
MIVRDVEHPRERPRRSIPQGHELRSRLVSLSLDAQSARSPVYWLTLRAPLAPAQMLALALAESVVVILRREGTVTSVASSHRSPR